MYDVGAFGKFNGWSRLNMVQDGWSNSICITDIYEELLNGIPK